MRFNVIDPTGTVSFVGPCHALKVMTAACARNPSTLSDLLEYATPFDDQLKQFLLNGLAVFDEHNTPESSEAIEAALASTTPDTQPPFRIINATTREASLLPVKAGLVIFNLPARRIIQVHNTYADVERQGRGRIRRGGSPTRKLYYYKLPDEWQLVP